MRSYLGRSRLAPERATVSNWSEKSAEVVVAVGNACHKPRPKAKDQTRRSVQNHVDATGTASDARYGGAGAIARMRAAGVKITEEPSERSRGGWMAFIEDPDGYEIELLSGETP